LWGLSQLNLDEGTQEFPYNCGEIHQIFRVSLRPGKSRKNIVNNN
jgi:hypothetical protein